MNPSFAQLAGARSVGLKCWGLHFLFGDGAFVPDSTGDDVFVSLVDVRNTRHAEA